MNLQKDIGEESDVVTDKADLYMTKLSSGTFLTVAWDRNSQIISCQ